MPPPPSESRSTELVSRAYKLQGFSTAADNILRAASKLEAEAAKETTYWNQILSVKQKGWSISKVPRDPRTLGVHFGFRDAVPAFRNRGFAALRRNADGSLRLDQGALPSRPVAAQVSITRNGRKSGMSSMPYAKFPSGDDIDEQILRARNTLYEEELFHELGREARLLANQGATMSSKQIQMPLDEHTQMQIDLIDLDNDSASNSHGLDEQLADGIAVALRILLSHAHEQNLQRRSQPPPPMTLKPRPMPEYALIRPVTTHLQHRSNLKSVTAFIETIIRPLSSAGMSCDLQSSFHSLDGIVLNQPVSPLATTTNTVNPTRHDHHLLIATFIQPPTTTLTLTLPTARPLKITLHTNLNAPQFGTEYTFSPQTLTYPSLSSSLSPMDLSITLPRLSRRFELEATLRHVLTLDIVHLISTTTTTKPLPYSPQPDPENDAATSAIAAATAKDAKSDTRNGEKWTPLDPHSGSLRSLGPQRTRLLFVKVWNDRFGLRHVGDAGSKSSKREEDVTTYLWDGSGTGGKKMQVGGSGGGGGGLQGKAETEVEVEGRGLLDIVREAMGGEGIEGWRID